MLVWDSPIGMKVCAPVGIVEIGIADGAAAVDHHVVSDVDSTVSYTLNPFTHGAIEEHNVTRLRLVIRYIPAQTAQPLGT